MFLSLSTKQTLGAYNCNIGDRLWQKQAEVENNKAAEINLNTIQLENFQCSFF